MYFQLLAQVNNNLFLFPVANASNLLQNVSNNVQQVQQLRNETAKLRTELEMKMAILQEKLRLAKEKVAKVTACDNQSSQFMPQGWGGGGECYTSSGLFTLQLTDTQGFCKVWIKIVICILWYNYLFYQPLANQRPRYLCITI